MKKECFNINKIKPRDVTINSGGIFYFEKIENTATSINTKIYGGIIPLFSIEKTGYTDMKIYNCEKTYNLNYGIFDFNNKLKNKLKKNRRNVKEDYKLIINDFDDNIIKFMFDVLEIKYNENKNHKFTFEELLNDENFAFLLAHKLNLPVEFLIETDFLRKDCYVSDLLKYNNIKKLTINIFFNNKQDFDKSLKKIGTASKFGNLKQVSRFDLENSFGNTIEYHAPLHGYIIKNKFIKIPKNITVNLSGIPGYILMSSDNFNYHKYPNISIDNQVCKLFTYDNYIFDIGLSLKKDEIEILNEKTTDESIYTKAFMKVLGNSKQNRNTPPEQFYFENFFYNYSSKLRSHVRLSGLLRLLKNLYKNDKIILNIDSCLKLGSEDENENEYVHIKNSFCVNFKAVFNDIFPDSDSLQYTEGNDTIYKISRYISSKDGHNLELKDKKKEYLNLKDTHNLLRSYSNSKLCMVDKSELISNKESKHIYRLIVRDDKSKKQYFLIHLNKKEYDNISTSKKYNRELCVFNYLNDPFIKKVKKDGDFDEFKEENIKNIVPKWVKECYKDGRWGDKPIVFYSKNN